MEHISWQFFKTRLFPPDNNDEGKYKEEFKIFYKEYFPITFFESLTKNSFIEFYQKVLDNCQLNYGKNDYNNEPYKNIRKVC